MAEVRSKLEELGLDEYSDTFISEGFDTWDTVVRITEDDLKDLNVKLGHRRKLQKAISDWKDKFEAPPNSAGLARNNINAEGVVDGGHDVARLMKQGSEGDQSSASTGRTKRKYRRHPKPDPNAPERPTSAYVLFSNYMRDLLKDQELSFTEMAKIVGEKWQLLHMETREQYERQAAAAKEKYNAELAEYKKTEQYAQYQQYLTDFKAKHSSQHGGDDKRARLHTENSNETTGSRDSYDTYSSASRRKSINSLYSVTSAASDAMRQDSPNGSTSHYSNGVGSPMSHRRSYGNRSPPSGIVTTFPNYLRPHHSDPSNMESPNHSHLNPPRATSSHQRPSYPYAHSDSAYHSTSGSSTTASLSHQNSLDSSAPTSASASHERLSRSPSSPIHSRILPPPIQSAAPVAARGLDHRPPVAAAEKSLSLDDPRSIPSLAALLQAGEMAREAEMRKANGG